MYELHSQSDKMGADVNELGNPGEWQYNWKFSCIHSLPPEEQNASHQFSRSYQLWM